MAIRNFWTKTTVDGRQTALEGGPRAKDGGFETYIRVRDHGEKKVALIVEGYARTDGTLALVVYDPDTDTDVYRREFTR